MARLRSLINKKWSWGKGIRWMIENDRGENECCYHCGNMANGVVCFQTDKNKFNVPFCKSHIAKMNVGVESAPFYHVIDRTKRINKNSVQSFTEWLSKTK